MSKPVHLKNAPITEAVIDFRVRIPTGVSLDHFRVAHESFANDYPRREERHSTEFSLPIGGAPTAPSTKRSVQGYFFHSHDGLQIVQFRLDGFTFSRLRPYHTWDAFLSEALRLWKVYEKVVNHAEISRVAVRYINHIRLPLPVELHEHLTAPPAVPSAWPQSMTEFLTRVALIDQATKLNSIVTQASEEGVDPTVGTVILDIDCFASEPFVGGGGDLKGTLEKLRDLKDRIFLNSLTPRALAEFE
jgi:uncharacterized protein (TIGR04255 family)